MFEKVTVTMINGTLGGVYRNREEAFESLINRFMKEKKPDESLKSLDKEEYEHELGLYYQGLENIVQTFNSHKTVFGAFDYWAYLKEIY